MIGVLVVVVFIITNASVLYADSVRRERRTA